MPVERQIVPINFGQGLDTKTDPKAVQPGKQLVLKDCVFTKPSRLTKRNGYQALPTGISGGTTMTNPKMIHEFKGQIVTGEKGKVYNLSDTQDKWIAAGTYHPVELSRDGIETQLNISGYTDVAIYNNYALYVYSKQVVTDSGGNITTSSDVYYKIVDVQSKNVIQTGSLNTSTVANNTPVRAVVLGGTVLAILYVKDDQTAIVSRTFTASGSGGFTVGSEVTVSANYYAGAATVSYPFDVCQTATGAAIIYRSTTGITIATLDTTGTIVNSINVADASLPATIAIPLSISLNSFNTNLWAYWLSMNGANYIINYSVVSATCVSVLAKTQVVSLGSTNASFNIISTSNSSTSQRCFYHNYSIFTPVTLKQIADKTNYIDTDSTGVVGTTAVYAQGVFPVSRPISITSANVTKTYAVMAYKGRITTSSTDPTTYRNNQTNIQPTLFLCKLEDFAQTNSPVVVARFGASVSNPQFNFLGNAFLINSTDLYYATTIKIQAESPATGLSFNSITLSGVINFVYSYYFNFNSDNVYMGYNGADNLVLNGANPSIYDGVTTNELGFHLQPEIYAEQTTLTGGAVANGTYSYIAIFQWVDAQGNQHQSAVSSAYQITTTGGNNTVVISFTNAFLTAKSKVNIAIYRTAASGTVYYLVTGAANLTYTATGAFGIASFNDYSADASITGNFQPYSYPASQVLENSTVPPSTIMLMHNNRLWFVDDENKNTIWYSKSFQPLVGLSPSAFLTQQIDAKFGNITALGEMDEKIVIFKERGVCVQSGDGANDTGTGASLSFPQFIPSDVGCNNLKSIITYPNGVLFKSPNGIYHINRSTMIEYIGMPVEDYNSQTITKATLIKGLSQIRFLCSSGYTLVYDYIFQQWSTFSNHTGLSATVWGNNYVYTTGTSILQETSGYYLDVSTAIAPVIQMSWLSMATIQGYERVIRLAMLGDFTSGSTTGHGVQVEIAYDYSSTFSTAVPFYFETAYSSNGPFQYRERLPRQKCDTLSIRITEITTGDSAEYIDFTNMSFEVGVKRGINKLGVKQSVG